MKVGAIKPEHYAFFAVGLAVLIIGKWLDTSESQYETSRPPVIQATEHPKREPQRPKRGAIVSPNAGYLPICVDSRDGLDEAIGWQLAHDTGEIMRTVLKYGGQAVGIEDKMKVLDPGLGMTKVRIISTDRECYVVSELTLQ